jgi:hemolysin activation/secretion protein
VGAGSDFVRFNGEVARIMRMSPGNQLLFRASGQASTEPLPVPEQFSLGGADTVRGYQQSEFLGDHGYAVSAEYRRTFYESGSWLFQGIAFVDHGFASLELSQVGERVNQRLTGAGIGARAQLGAKTSLRLDIATPVDPTPNANGEESAIYGQLTTRL